MAGKVGLIAADCRPSVIITSHEILRDSNAAIRAFSDEIDAKVVVLEAPQAQCAWRPTLPDQSEVAFLQYTSGSTGVPKGVINSHGPLIRNLRFNHRLLGSVENPASAS